MNSNCDFPTHKGIKIFYCGGLLPHPLSCEIMSLLAMAPSLFAFYMASSVDFKNEKNLFTVRVLYFAVVAAQLLTAVFVYLAVKSKSDQSELSESLIWRLLIFFSPSFH
jgi:hypothetical protein